MPVPGLAALTVPACARGFLDRTCRGARVPAYRSLKPEGEQRHARTQFHPQHHALPLHRHESWLRSIHCLSFAIRLRLCAVPLDMYLFARRGAAQRCLLRGAREEAAACEKRPFRLVVLLVFDPSLS